MAVREARGGLEIEGIALGLVMTFTTIVLFPALGDASELHDHEEGRPYAGVACSNAPPTGALF